MDDLAVMYVWLCVILCVCVIFIENAREKKRTGKVEIIKFQIKKSQIKRTKINFVFQNKFQTISHSHSLFICKFKSYFVFEIDRNKRRNKKKTKKQQTNHK